MDGAQSISDRYDQAAPAYEREYPEVTQRLYWMAYDHLTWRAVEAVLPTDGRSLRVLDAGGGGGKFGLRFAALGHQVTVLDLSQGMLDLAQQRFLEQNLLAQATFVLGNILALPFPDAAFDLIFCEGDPVSYCVERYSEAIGELLRVAAPSAPVVLGVDNRQEYFVGELRYGEAKKALGILLGGRASCPYGLPIHTFTPLELRRAIVSAGGQVETIFGKPVLFHEVLAALRAERGADLDLWAARDEILAIQATLAHDDFAGSGGHLQVMARRLPSTAKESA